jgi:hypothetical protein
MNHLLNGFADELVKVAGVGKSLFKVVRKHPIASLMGASILASTGLAAHQGYKSGLHGAERGRFIRATRDSPSQAAFINYHQLFKHKPSQKEVERLSEHHREKTFRSYRKTPKPEKRNA